MLQQVQLPLQGGLSNRGGFYSLSYTCDYIVCASMCYSMWQGLFIACWAMVLFCLVKEYTIMTKLMSFCFLL